VVLSWSTCMGVNDPFPCYFVMRAVLASLLDSNPLHL